ncbi:3-phosphoshikimate 1-carboxyvinyltransferase [Oceanisphaera profunda]|uniref:3-phosphoshikimate 1-carboxyvinyltransferase n=1 Tax=Oceanisphaera profunda TaxID=1416627 RepID=A0A1Y0D1X6_9GAMM|nr:3-phosphoshikimate 1-carboxyvinyltransferase [Oceanisphaera profunda]ART81530.1 3-phosphoshikimate 1-carboxyvinyltransferase [Oceanisphaera profunda]
MESLKLSPIARVEGTVNLPGSKSLSNRALLLAAQAQGITHLTNLLDSDDTRYMLDALRALGVQYELSADKTECVVHGLGRAFSAAEPISLFLGNAGTAMRPLCAALCLGTGEFTLTGEPRMWERPIGHLVEALREAGAEISYLKTDGYPPVFINGKGLWGGDVHIDGSVSSQFLTALLMAAPMASGDIRVHIKGELVSKPYIDITLHAMSQFGVELEHDNYQTFYIKGNQTYVSPGQFLVEGDASSASYFLAAGAIKGKVRVTGVGSNSIQGDVKFADVLAAMGAKITWGENFIEAENIGPLHAVDMDMNHIPDAAMTIATTALFATGTTRISNIHNWRVKETDRLYAMATELRKLGVEVEEGEDYIVVTPTAELKEAEIATYNDHRIAMCFSLVALSDTAVVILDPKCTAKTFPDYFEQLASISS